MVEGVGEETASTRRRTVFISHASQDAAVANAVVGALEGAGMACWIAPRNVVPGALYAGEIVRAINESSVVVLVLSAQAVASPHVSKELERASSKCRRIIALRTDAAVLPHAFEYFLSESQWIDAGTGSIEPAAAKLAEAVRHHLESGLEKSADDSQTVALARNTTVITDYATEQVPSIAVLPFANMSGDKEQEYFSDGLAEEIINALAQIQGLKVIARTSAFTFKGRNADIREISRTLGVAHVLEGSVRNAGGRIRVTAQLIAASDGSHLWSERFDREMTDIFAVQDEISAAITKALKVRFNPKADAAPRYTPAFPAYEALLKARHFHWQAGKDSMDQAEGFYQQAISLDPGFALAHAEYAEYLFGRAVSTLSPMRKVAPTMRSLAQRALALDPHLADAHLPLCLVAAAHDYDWKEAERQFRLATPGGRGTPLTHMGCGWTYLLGSGQREAAVEQLRLAVQGDPLHLASRNLLAMCLGAVGRFLEAEELLLQTRDLAPDYRITNACLANHYADRQMYAAALPFAEEVAKWEMRLGLHIGQFAGLLVRDGQTDRAKRVLETLGSEVEYGFAMGMGLYHSRCGEIDKAAAWFEKAIAERYSSVPPYLQGAIGEPLRASPHWPRLAALMNLPGCNL
jgi:TolB-like protein